MSESIFSFSGTLPNSSHTHPNNVIGQTNFSGTSVNAGGSTSGSSLNGPKGVYSDGSHLFVTDTGNNRVILFNAN